MMTKKLQLSISILFLGSILIFFLFPNNELTEMEKLREQHKDYIENSPFKDTKNLVRSSRKKLGLPPNAYYEREFELTMNPRLGYPTPFKVAPINSDIIAKGLPGTGSSLWTERGPSNVGGRTRVVFYDPNDVGVNNGDGINYNRVFAGAVGGGLWVNNNIEDENSSWVQVPGIAAGLNISCYAIDPNNSNIWYLGTGEQSTNGAAVGNGVYRSTDGGNNWSKINIPPAGPGDLNVAGDLFNAGFFFVNDIAIRNNEIYVGVGAASYASPNFNISSPSNTLGVQNAGLYRSADSGVNWSRVETPSFRYTFSGQNFYFIPHDIDIDGNNEIVLTTISAPGIGGSGGGRIFKSTDGLNWTSLRAIPNANRVEIAISKQNKNKIYVLAQVGNQADLFLTTDQFATLSPINEPNDADNGISSNDFTRGQAFYDLVIEVDPNDDSIVYAGGIDAFRSTDSGNFWAQMSKWSENPNLNTISAPFIHADIHAISFKPNNSNQGLIGSDGGVSWANNFSTAPGNRLSINTRIKNYNVTQFYYGGISQNATTEGFIGGSQDNGTTGNFNATSGLNEFSTFSGGDGAFSDIDPQGLYAISSFQYRNHRYINYANPSSSYCINGSCSDNTNGDFINVAELDGNLDILYANSKSFSGFNAIESCRLLPNSAICTTITNSEINSSRPTALKISPFTVSSSKLYVGTETGFLFLVQNANSSSNTWTNIGGNSFFGSISDIAFGANEQQIFVTMHNYGVSSIWYTSNGGTTWQEKEGDLPDIPVKAILQNPLIPTEVIIGTELGLYATGNFDSVSPNWFPIINGMTNVKVLDLDLRASDNTILATTHGRGMFTGKFTTAGFSDVTTRSNNVKIYPTVSSGTINIISGENIDLADIRVYSLAGQEVWADRLRLTGSEQRLILGDLNSGIYLVKIIANGISETQKIIIK